MTERLLIQEQIKSSPAYDFEIFRTQQKKESKSKIHPQKEVPNTDVPASPMLTQTEKAKSVMIEKYAQEVITIFWNAELMTAHEEQGKPR